ncbi:YggN family protein [Paraglaciecola aestuariivivens]
MRKTILATTLALSTMPALAHQCNVEFVGNLQLQDKVLSVKVDSDTKMSVDEFKTLRINGSAVTLSSEQQQWVNQYYDGIYQAAPQAAGIAKDAISLASIALNEVFSELLGSDNDALADITERMTQLDQQIQYNFYADNGEIRLSSDAFENGEFFGQQWESQFEESIEALVTDSIGHLMVALGSQLIFSGGDMQEFEQKMERFGNQIEQKVEYQAEALEHKADALCATLKHVDYAETQMQQINQLQNLDVIQIQAKHNSM